MMFTTQEARRQGYSAIVFFGHPDYYPRFGFKRAAEYGITDAAGNMHDAHMAMELFPGALSGAGGKFYEDPVFEDLPKEEVIAFDRGFPFKAPREKISIDILLCRLSPEAREAVAGLNLTWLSQLRGVSEGKISGLPGIDSAAIETIRRVMGEHGRKWG